VITIVSAPSNLGLDATAMAARSNSRHVGYWIHVDVDVLDPTFMPAVDSPDAGGPLIS
jgi:arginase